MSTSEVRRNRAARRRAAQRRRDAPAEGVNGSVSLPFLHRVAVVYLALPVLIWVGGWFQPWAASLAGLAILFCLVEVLWNCPRPQVDYRRLFLVSGVSLGLTMITPAGGAWDIANPDWLRHAPTIADLAKLPWPVRYESGGESLILRTYAGFHIVPGLVGKLSLDWIPGLVFLWTWCGFGLGLALLADLFGRKWVLIPLLLFLAFGPLYAGLAVFGLEDVTRLTGPLVGPLVMAQLMPHHFIAGTILTGILARQTLVSAHLPSIGLVLAAALFWSPWVALGALPFLAFCVEWKSAWRGVVSWSNVAACLPAGLVVLYLQSGAGLLTWGIPGDSSAYAAGRVLGHLVIGGPLLAFAAAMISPTHRRDRRVWGAGVVILAAHAPGYWIGPLGDQHKLAVVPMMFLTTITAVVVMGLWGQLWRGSPYWRPVVVLALGCYSLATVSSALGVGAALSAPGRYSYADIPEGSIIGQSREGKGAEGAVERYSLKPLYTAPAGQPLEWLLRD